MKKFILAAALGVCLFVLPGAVMAQQTYLTLPIGSHSLSAGGTIEVIWGGGDTMPSYGDTFVYCINQVPMSAVSGTPGFTSFGYDYLSVSDISTMLFATTGSYTGTAQISIEYNNEDDYGNVWAFTTVYTIDITS